MRPLPFWLPRPGVRAWNAVLHPRGPDGRFTKSFATTLGINGKKRKNAAKKKFTPRKPFRSPAEASTWLAGLSTAKSDGVQLKTANQALRAGHEDDPAVKSIAQSMKPLPEDVTVFRKVPAAKFGTATPQDLLDMLVSDAGYFPTTVAPSPAGPGDVQIRIDVPAGTPAAADPDTHELILDAGLEMAVDDVQERPDGGADMHLVVLDGADASGEDSPTPEDSPEVDDRPAEFNRRAAAASTGAGGREAAPRSLVRNGGLDLPEPQREALAEYLSENYQPINHTLRGGEDAGLARHYTTRAQVDGWVANIDAAMADSRLTEDVVGYRGIANAERIFGDRVNGDMTGMEWHEDAYVSTSTDQAVSEDFASNSPPGSIMMRVLIPAGTGGVELSDESYESELMLERGLTMRVVSDSGVDGNGRRWLDVEVVPIDAT